MNLLKSVMVDAIEMFGPPLIFALALLGLSGGGGLLLAEALGEYRCGTYSDMTGLETQWIFLDGCYVNTAQGWVPR